MQKIPDEQWWQKGWTIPVSIVLHLAIVGVFFLQLPDFPTEVAEPESISVDLVPPPEAPPPPPEPEPEQKQPEEQAPPPPPPAPDQPQEAVQPLTPTLPSIAVRPEPQQEDAVDNPGSSPEDASSDANTNEPVEEAAEEPVETASAADEKPTPEAETASTPLEENPPPSSDDGELAPPDPAKTEPAEKTEVAKPQEKPVEDKPVEQKSATQPPKTDAPKKLTSAKKILSARAINNPAMRSMLGDLPPRRRIVQMCSIEALAQLREMPNASGGLDGIVPYSETGGMISGNVLNASGGAFNVDNRWYDITFRCEVDLDNFNVTSFQYEIGKTAVPQADAIKRGYPTR